MKRGFTLIELLVVIAIIAILAAILFPVFAQAKASAKQTACLSNIKQVNTGTMMYLSDNDDLYPLATPKVEGEYQWGLCADLPWDWEPGIGEDWYEANRTTWGNSVQPYIKSLGLEESPVQQVLKVDGCLLVDPSQAQKKFYSANYAMNGLLEQYSGSAVAQPGKLISFSQPLGKTSILGMYISDPYLYCPKANQACKYVPTKSSCSGSNNGEWSFRWNDPENNLYPAVAHGRGSNFAYVDGHAKFQRMGANIKGRTDYRVDTNSQYDATGRASMSWYDDFYCHALLYRPDFDFTNFGSPYEGP